jgi:hypothetical protein
VANECELAKKNFPPSVGRNNVAPIAARRLRRLNRKERSVIAKSGPFSGREVQPGPIARKRPNRPFFCCEPVSACYKPAATIVAISGVCIQHHRD